MVVFVCLPRHWFREKHELHFSFTCLWFSARYVSVINQLLTGGVRAPDCWFSKNHEITLNSHQTLVRGQGLGMRLLTHSHTHRRFWWWTSKQHLTMTHWNLWELTAQISRQYNQWQCTASYHFIIIHPHRTLSCAACHQVTDVGLSSLSRCHRLNDMNISYCAVSKPMILMYVWKIYGNPATNNSRTQPSSPHKSTIHKIIR